MLGVQVLRSGDEDGVDSRVIEEMPIVGILAGGGGDGARLFQAAGGDVGHAGTPRVGGAGGGSDGARLFQAAGVDVGHAGTLSVGAGEGVAQELGSARAGADDAEAYA